MKNVLRFRAMGSRAVNKLRTIPTNAGICLPRRSTGSTWPQLKWLLTSKNAIRTALVT